MWNCGSSVLISARSLRSNKTELEYGDKKMLQYDAAVA